MRVRKEIVFRTAAIVFGLVLAIGAGEITCRVIGPPDDGSPTRTLKDRMQIRPYTMLHYAGNVRLAAVNTNTLGYRGTQETPEYPDQVTTKTKSTVILTGGSTAFGRYATSDEASLAVQLEKMLSAERPTEVINLAMGGYNSFAQFVAVARYGILRSPDLIIVMDGFNDVALHVMPSYREAPGYTTSYDDIEKAVLSYRPPRLGFSDNYRWAAIPKHSALLRRILGIRYVSFANVYGEQERLNGTETMTDANAERIVALYRHSEEMLMRLANASGCRVLLATQPMRDYPGEAREVWRQQVFRLYPRLIEAGRSVCQRWNNATYLDLTEAMPAPNAESFFDRVHLNDGGQQKVAEILAARIKAAGLLNQAAPSPNRHSAGM